MAKIEDDSDVETNESDSGSKVNRKKVLLILIPVLIIIAVIVSYLTIFNKNLSSDDSKTYNIVTQTSGEAGGTPKTTIFYDLPEILVQVKSTEDTVSTLKMKINIELNNVEDIKTIEMMMPKITDIIISHVVELTVDEIHGVNGLYWLKEELLHRINLVVSPIVVSNLNFKAFELQTANTGN